MNDLIYRKMYSKYRNNIIRNLPELLTEFLHKNPNYIDILDNNFISLEEILYWLRNKPYNNRKELLDWILMYVELRHGIFERAKQFTAKSRNDK